MLLLTHKFRLILKTIILKAFVYIMILAGFEGENRGIRTDKWEIK